MKTLTDQLDINIQEELNSPQAKSEMKAILANGMVELAGNMKELGKIIHVFCNYLLFFNIVLFRILFYIQTQPQYKTTFATFAII